MTVFEHWKKQGEVPSFQNETYILEHRSYWDYTAPRDIKERMLA